MNETTIQNTSRVEKLKNLYNAQGYLIVAHWGSELKIGDIIDNFLDVPEFTHPFRIIEEVSIFEMIKQARKLGVISTIKFTSADFFYKIITD